MFIDVLFSYLFDNHKAGSARGKGGLMGAGPSRVLASA